jgi:hypothetical protein
MSSGSGEGIEKMSLLTGVQQVRLKHITYVNVCNVMILKTEGSE